MANEIKFYLSGGASNTNPFQSNGGTISNTEIVNGLLNNLWPDISESDAANGITDHKIIFVKNVSGGALTAVRAYFGELDKFTGMAILNTTTKNTSTTALATATDPVTQYFVVWQNAAETPTQHIACNNTNKRVALTIALASFPAYNQFPDQVEIMLAKTGAPTGTATVKVWAQASGVVPSATDNTVIRTLGTLDVSTLTTTFTKKTFNTVSDLVQNPLPGVGWRIGIEYTAGTATAYLMVGQTVTTPTTNKGGFAQAWDGSKWLDFAANWPSMNISTNHGPCFQGGNLPPPGGGVPPPGNCGATAPAAGTIPVAGGGGGTVNHGYAITAATDNGNDGNVAANAIDRDLNTRWSQNSTNALLTLDMGASHPIDRVKIAWYKGDERQAKFNIAYSTDNVTYTNVVAGGGASFMSSGHSTQLEEFSFVQQAGTTATTVGGVTSVTVTLEVPWLAMQTGDSPGGTDAASIVRDLADELLECTTNPITNGNGADKGWMDKNGFEICDLCENHSNATSATFPDGLKVPYYWDTGSTKCVAPGAATGGVAISENPVYSNHGGVVIGNPTVYLIFWGPTWASQTTYKNTVIDLVQNKLLGTDASTFFATAKADYNFNTPKWGGQASNTNSPANTNNYTSADVMVAIQQAIAANSVPNPASDSFTTMNGQRCSNIVYAVIPDLSWHAHIANDDTSIAEAIHLSMTYTTQTGDPNPPPVPPPPSTSPGPNPFSARYIRYIGLGNTTNTWNSVTEFEIWGSDVGNPSPSPPPGNGGGGENFSKPSSYDSGLPLPDLNNNDFVAIHLERQIPPGSNHSEIENYSIVISNEAHPQPPTDEPIPGSDPNLPPTGSIPLPTPPGVFDPGTIPPPGQVPPPTDGGQCPGDPNQPPGPAPDPGDGGGGGGTPGGGGTGTTPDGIKLVELPAGYTYGDQHTNFKENFQSNGSFRLDCGVQPQMNQCNLTFYLNLSSGSDEISSKLSGGTHTDSKPKNGRCYDIGLNQDGKRVRIRKEDPHPSYHDGPSHSINIGSVNAKWVGVQSLKWNEGNNCHLQCWVDTSGSVSPTNKWTKILDDIDTGGWFEPPYLTCYASNDSQTTIRVDSMSTSKFHYKFLCLTRINH